MRNKISDRDRLLHIRDAIESIEEFTKDITYEEYNKDYKLKLALVKLIEIIGEAARTITEETQDKFTEIEWSILKGIRNILVHEYFGIDYKIIWNTIKNKIPELKNKINILVNELDK